jgi:hypothetical protein
MYSINCREPKTLVPAAKSAPGTATAIKKLAIRHKMLVFWFIGLGQRKDLEGNARDFLRQRVDDIPNIPTPIK